MPRLNGLWHKGAAQEPGAPSAQANAGPWASPAQKCQRQSAEKPTSEAKIVWVYSRTVLEV
jgi:hypothetical protein